MKLLIEKYIHKTFGRDLVEDLKLVLGEKVNVLNMLNKETMFLAEGEINFRKHRLLGKFKRLSKHKAKERAASVHAQNARQWLAPDSPVIFVNGIVTSMDLAEHQAINLARAIQQPVALIHNETDGLIKDLIECNQGRYGIINPITEKVIAAILAKLEAHNKLDIVAYSQGAIIVSAALMQLSGQLSANRLSGIRYFTFGAGFRESVLPDEIYCEHFANTEDPITKLGLQHPHYTCSGQLYLRPAKGHFFIADYLVPMLQGASYGDSQFEKMLNK